MNPVRVGLAALLAAASLTMVPAAHADSLGDQAPILGVWRNPKNSVHVEIRPCGEGACGHVVWANAKAKADAREGGTEELVGLQLFRNLKPSSNGVWKGKVFVPDMNRTFSGTAEAVDGTSLRARGCLLGAVLCKSQVWRRVGSAS